MLSKEKLAAMKYLKKEFDNLQHDPILSLGCTVGLVNNDIFHWKITLLGPVDTPYAGGLFILTADFPEKYPNVKPEVKFVNKIYHLNVDWKNPDTYGHICLSSLNEWATTGKVSGKPCYGVKQALFDIFCLFYNQGVDSPYDDDIAAEYRDRRNEFDAKAREWTQKYAK